MNEADIRDLLEHARNKRYAEVVEGYSHLSTEKQEKRVTMMAFADALYELGRDIECLRAYVNFVLKYPDEKATGYARYAIAVSLKNLNLQTEALEILRTIDPEHENLAQEIEHSNETIALQREAKSILKDLAENS